MTAIEMERKLINDSLIKKEERDRIYYSALTEKDFNTSAPCPHNIDRIVIGINDYLRQKAKD